MEKWLNRKIGKMEKLVKWKNQSIKQEKLVKWKNQFKKNQLNGNIG